MKTNNYFNKIFSLSVIVTLIGAFIKIQHLDYTQPFLILGLIFTLGCITIGIIEVTNSTRIKTSEKIMWTVGK